MDKDRITAINVDRLKLIIGVINKSVDILINSKVDGVLKRPESPAELELFTESVNGIINNKLRSKLGV